MSPYSNAPHPTPSHTVLLGRHVQPTGEGWVFCSSPWGQNIYIRCLQFFYTGFCLLTHLLIQLFVSVQIQEHLFYTYLFCCLNRSSFGHWELFQWALVSLWHAPIIILFFSPFILFFFLFIMTKDYYPSEFPLVWDCWWWTVFVCLKISLFYFHFLKDVFSGLLPSLNIGKMHFTLLSCSFAVEM